jgi:diguanylate cyclase (GGDEF)-like protein
LSETDTITVLANRRRLDEFMAGEWQRVQRHGSILSAIALDIDHFKRVNDVHGHGAGDEVLRHVARVLRERMRSTDVVARVGGEEFVVVLPHAGLEGALATAERLRTDVARLRPPPLPYDLSASFGVASYEAGDTPRSLLARADEALYAAKRAGRNRVECAPPRPAPSYTTA